MKRGYNLELVVDTNIVLAGLLRPSVTQEILLSRQNRLFLPEYSLREIEKHSEEFMKRMGKTRREFEMALFTIISNVKIMPHEEYESLEQKALSLCPEKHRDDWPFIALALKLNCPLWSNDSALKRQTAVKVYSTSELLEKLK